MSDEASPNSSQSIQRWSIARLLGTLGGCAILWVVAALACMCVGSRGGIGWPTDSLVRSIRLDVVLCSSLVGAALATAGVVYQAILQNPLADPYLLGVSTGASLFTYLWRLPMLGALSAPLFAVMSQQACAFAGAMAAIAVVMALATRRGRLEPITLLLVGVIVNSINGALFLLMYSLHPALGAGLGGPIGFLIGSIQTNLTPAQEWTAAAVVAVGFIALLALAGQLNAATLNESEAQSLGIPIYRLRWIGIGLASIVTAAAVSISGPIGFVGLICPHIARRLFGPDTRRLLPLSAALGAALLCIADALSRAMLREQFAGTQLPVGVITALLGGPFFLILLLDSRTTKYTGASRQ